MKYYLENDAIHDENGTVVGNPAILFDRLHVYAHGEAAGVRALHEKMTNDPGFDPRNYLDLGVLELRELQIDKAHECHLLLLAAEAPVQDFAWKLSEVLFFDIDPNKWLDGLMARHPVDIYGKGPDDGAASVFMALDAVLDGPDGKEWDTVATASRPVKDVDGIRRILDDCVSSMTAAHLAKDYRDPLACIRELQSAGRVSVPATGFVYGDGDLEALYGILGQGPSEIFGEDPAGTRARKTRVVAAIYKKA